MLRSRLSGKKSRQIGEESEGSERRCMETMRAEGQNARWM